jgi:hypothetical protein
MAPSADVGSRQEDGLRTGRERRMETCDHTGFHSGETRYDSATGTLRCVVVCDACRRELREILVQPYAPSFDPRGNDAYAGA